MGRIIAVEEIEKVSKELHAQRKKIVLVGGCFDILHVGHIIFLERAKQVGDVLFVEVESDQRIRKLKGANRPINSQVDRAHVLSNLTMVDYVILLPDKLSDDDYLSITKMVMPHVLATTSGDPKNKHLYRQAKLLGVKVSEVTCFLKGKSTSELAQVLGFD